MMVVVSNRMDGSQQRCLVVAEGGGGCWRRIVLAAHVWEVDYNGLEDGENKGLGFLDKWWWWWHMVVMEEYCGWCA